MAKKVKPKKSAPPQLITVPPRDRFWDAITRKQLPADVKNNLAGALNGNLIDQTKMFWAMMDTWPRLQSNITDMQDAVAGQAPTVTPYTKACDCDPTPEALKKAEFVEMAIEKMRGSMVRNELAFEGLVRNIIFGFYAPPAVIEIYWDKVEDGILPTTAKPVSPRYYGFPNTGELADELRLYREGINYGDGEEWPEHQFAIASRLSYPGHPSIASPMRVMTTYWAAATFGVQWLTQYAQLFGVPFRWAECANDGDTARVEAMLQSMGSSGVAAVPAGTKIQFQQPVSGTSLPQRELIELADKKCDIWVRGETLTSDEGSSGSRSLGEVHERQFGKRKQAVADFAGHVITQQLVRSILEVNYGSDDDMPEVTFELPDAGKDQARVDRIKKIVVDMKVPLARDYVYEQLGVEMPDEDDEIFEPKQEEPEPGAPGAPGAPGGKPAPWVKGNAGGAGGEPVPGKQVPGKQKVSAARAENPVNPDLEELAEQTLSGLGQLKRQWLNGARSSFDGILSLISDPTVSDKSLIAGLREASEALPQGFGYLDTRAVADALDGATMSAIVSGADVALNDYGVSRRVAARDGFDPNQPRDGDGKWTRTGSHFSKAADPEKYGSDKSRGGLKKGDKVKVKNKSLIGPQYLEREIKDVKVEEERTFDSVIDADTFAEFNDDLPVEEQLMELRDSLDPTLPGHYETFEFVDDAILEGRHDSVGDALREYQKFETRSLIVDLENTDEIASKSRLYTDAEAQAKDELDNLIDPTRHSGISAVHPNDPDPEAAQEKITKLFKNKDSLNYNQRLEIQRRTHENMVQDAGGSFTHEDAEKITDAWNLSSNDNNYESLSTQQAAAQEFGGDLSYWQEQKILDRVNSPGFSSTLAGGDNSEELRDDLMSEGVTTVTDYKRKVLRDMHRRTQELLEEDGIEELVLYRGVKLPGARSATGVGDVVRLEQSNALESWSSSKNAAANFAADNPNAIVIKTVVKADRIVSTPVTGFGTLREKEFIVHNGGETLAAIIMDEGTKRK